ncbi:hypothetical protein AB0H18_06465 [Streptomyces sp. NPDC020766]|uniref:hypothetical protein n=1 Tax=Streptomyces sp. NPDC020766 TaxID=3155011 RepID=UPI003406FEDD
MSLVAENGVVASLAQMAAEAASVPFFLVRSTQEGSRLVSVYNSEGQHEGGRDVRRLELLARLAERKRIDPGVTRTASLAEAPNVLAALGRRKLTGRTVVRVS